MNLKTLIIIAIVGYMFSVWYRDLDDTVNRISNIQKERQEQIDKILKEN
jgi:hypothetical protein